MMTVQMERLFNIYTGSYLFSKLNSLLLIGFLQTLLFTTILFLIYASTENPMNAFVKMTSWLLFINLVSAVMGLLISTAMKTSDKVLALVPIILIPQLMLSGVITKLNNSFIEFLSYFTFSRWGTEGIAHIQRTTVSNGLSLKVDSSGQPVLNSVGDFMYEKVRTKENAVTLINEQYNDSYSSVFGEFSKQFVLDFGALSVLGLLLFVLTYFILKMKVNQ
jgi:hypothetical protein